MEYNTALMQENSCNFIDSPIPLYKRVKPCPIEPTLSEALREFENKPLTPHSLTDYWQKRWNCLNERGHFDKITIKPCPYTQDEIDTLGTEERMLIYNPEEITLHHLISMHPEIKSSYWNNTIGQNIKNTAIHGWLDIESSDTPQYTDTTDQELSTTFQKQNRQGMHLLAYIIASLDFHDRTGAWLDHIKAENGYRVIPCRLLGSWNNTHNLPLVAQFYPWGELSFASYTTIETQSFFGARSIGCKKS